MPNGYRRGGGYTRNGRTHYRRGSSIAQPRTVVSVAAVGICVGAFLAGGPLVAHPVVLTGVVAAVVLVGVGLYAGRRHVARWGRRRAARQRIADRQWVKQETARQKAVSTTRREQDWQHRPTLVARTGARR